MFGPDRAPNTWRRHVGKNKKIFMAESQTKPWIKSNFLDL